MDLNYYTSRFKRRFKRLIIHYLFRSVLTFTTDRVYVAGWTASGSTFIYQVLSEFDIPVTKIHGLPKHYTFERTFFTIRDPRDIVLSTARRHFAEVVEKEGLKSAILKGIKHFVEFHRCGEDYFRACKLPNLIVLRYETFFQQSERVLVQFLSDLVARPIGKIQVDDILKKNSIEANIRRMKKMRNFQDWDQETQIHGRHISNIGKIGGWKSAFDYDTAKIFHEEIGDLLISLKYEESSKWIEKLRR